MTKVKSITEEEVEVKNAEDTKSLNETKEEKVTKNGKKILIVEDEKPMARALQLKLDHEGYEVTVEHDGESALETLGKEKFSLIICDLVMPKVDGFDMLGEIKNKQSNVPIIVVSNLSQKEDKEKSMALGASEFYIKSDVSLSEIVSNVKKLLA